MRAWLSLLLAAMTAPAFGAGAIWTSACQDQQIQYQQIVGGKGYLHVSHDDGTYTTVKLKQTYLSATRICGAVPAKVKPEEIAVICADDTAQTLNVIWGGQWAKGLKPKDAPFYCSAVVNHN